MAVASVLRMRTPSLLVEEEVEIAGGVGLDGVELALSGGGAEAGEGELLGAWSLSRSEVRVRKRECAEAER